MSDKPTIAKTDHELLVEIHDMLTAMTDAFTNRKLMPFPAVGTVDAIGSDQCGANVVKIIYPKP